MKVKELIKELKKQNPEDEVVLWRWTDKGSCYTFLSKLLNHKNPKGIYEIGVNEHMPVIYDRKELKNFVSEMEGK